MYSDIYNEKIHLKTTNIFKYPLILDFKCITRNAQGLWCDKIKPLVSKDNLYLWENSNSRCVFIMSMHYLLNDM